MKSLAISLGEMSTRAVRAIARAFPMPQILMPKAAGIDISDASVKWMVFRRALHGLEIESFGEMPLASGIVVSGAVHDVPALAHTLSEVKQHLAGATAAHGALPEEAAYVFSMPIPHATPRQQILRMIEFEFEGRVPIPPAAAVYDYTPIRSSPNEQEEISVVVFPKDIAGAYAAAFEGAGITLLSLEVEASSIARAISSEESTEPITLIADIGRARTGFAVLKRGVPIFTSTVAVGGDAIERALIEGQHLSKEEMAHFKTNEGLEGRGAAVAAREAIMPAVTALADEVARHYRYWDTRKNEQGERMTPVGKVILIGGNANLRGLAEFLTAKIQAEVTLAQTWRHAVDFDAYIPPIDRGTSLQFATTIGLALRGI
jgi:type IV pilus assembly protein PilM